MLKPIFRSRPLDGAPRVLAAIVLGLAVGSAACGLFNSSSTSPTSTSGSGGSTPPASGTTETFSGTLALAGSSMYNFTAASAGTVSVTLATLTPPSSAGVKLGLGTPSGPSTCVITSSTTGVVASSTAQMAITEPAGSYCVNISDPGTLTTASTFSITIQHN
jgi:hypothetical protein